MKSLGRKYLTKPQQYLRIYSKLLENLLQKIKAEDEDGFVVKKLNKAIKRKKEKNEDSDVIITKKRKVGRRRKIEVNKSAKEITFFFNKKVH